MEKRQRSESEDSNSTKELSSWTHITSAFTELHNLRLQNDIVVNKINKVHSKVNSREESKEGFTIKAGLRIQEVYRNAIDYAEQEIRVLKRTMEKVEGLIALQERLDSEKKRRKEMKQRPKIEEEGFMHDMKVAAKIGQEWILAVVVGSDKGRIEIEDVEEDDDHPGTKKRYILPPKLLLPIVFEKKLQEFPTGHEVLALYPASSCFYKANVILPPSENNTGEFSGEYIVRFEDDGGFERNIVPHMVLDYPGK